MFSTKSFFVGTTTGIDLINIGHDVRGLIRESRLEQGLVTITCPLDGGGMAILSSEGRLAQERRDELKKEISRIPLPLRGLIPPTLTLPVERGKMVCEPWRDLFLIDFDPSARRREVIVQMMSETEAQPGRGPAKGGRR